MFWKCEAARVQDSSSCYRARPILCDNYRRTVVVGESSEAPVVLEEGNEVRRTGPVAAATLQVLGMVAVVHTQRSMVRAWSAHRILVGSLLCVVFV